MNPNCFRQNGYERLGLMLAVGVLYVEVKRTMHKMYKLLSVFVEFRLHQRRMRVSCLNVGIRLCEDDFNSTRFPFRDVDFG